MNPVALFATAAGASMDALAVSVVQGVLIRRKLLLQALIISGAFGFAQGVMPLIGWLVGHQFADAIGAVDHWIVLAILVTLGGKMLWEALRAAPDADESAEDSAGNIRYTRLFTMAVATSIDALALGATFAFLQVNILLASALIALVTFIVCFAGVLVGQHFGSKFKTYAEVAGGIVLILIGFGILYEHLS